MTILEALQSQAGYNIKTSVLEKQLIDAGICPSDEYTKEIGEMKEFQLALAYSLWALLTLPNVTEGDYSVSWGNKDGILALINYLLRKWGLDPLGEPTIMFKKDWSC